MKPFNLEKALAGEPVVTRDGRKVTAIYHFTQSKSNFSVIAHIEKSYSVDTFTVNGKWEDGIEDNNRDLFMGERERWINIYWDENEQKAFSGGGVYATELEAKENGKGQNYQTTIKLK